MQLPRHGLPNEQTEGRHCRVPSDCQLGRGVPVATFVVQDEDTESTGVWTAWAGYGSGPGRAMQRAFGAVPAASVADATVFGMTVKLSQPTLERWMTRVRVSGGATCQVTAAASRNSPWHDVERCMPQHHPGTPPPSPRSTNFAGAFQGSESLSPLCH